MRLADDVGSVLREQPVAAIAVLFYVALKSSTILPDLPFATSWHPSYCGWYDLVLWGAAIITLASARCRPGLGFWAYAAAALLVAAISFVANDVSLLSAEALDGLANLARLLCGVVLGYAIARGAGDAKANGFLGLVVLVLAGGSLFVFAQVRETGFVRFFASGMSVASFAQVLAAATLSYLHHRRWGLLSFSVFFLLLTFSRTALVAAMFAVLVRAIQTGQAQRKELARMLAGAALVAGVLLVVGRGTDFELAMSELLNVERLETLSGRSLIWTFAASLISEGRIGAFGVGFGATPGLLSGMVVLNEDGTDAQHFHSLPLELVLGVGVLSIVLLAPVLLRLLGSLKRKVYPAASTYLILLVTQAVDFTLYRPKELLLWGFLLGLGEAQWGAFPDKAGEKTTAAM